LKQCGYVLLDTQFNNDHIAQFGVVEIPRSDYLRQLHAALEVAVTPLG
jgi:leucyl/phenylalanyl-tRNA--protein transferase